ncbi:hypothetical protein D3C87_95650 [compost metagenome]
MKRFIQNIRLNPRRLFLIDGLGACMTALVFFGLLIPFHQLLGIPEFALRILFLIAVIFAVYSFSCFFFLKNNHRFFLRVIAFGNFLYCCLTLFFVIAYFQELILVGLIYFLLEIAVIAGLVYLELKASAYEG